MIQGLGVPPEPAQDSREVIQRARSLLKQGYSRRDIMKLLGTETGMKRNTLYRLLINCV